MGLARKFIPVLVFLPYLILELVFKNQTPADSDIIDSLVNFQSLAFHNKFRALNQSTVNMKAEKWEAMLPPPGNSTYGSWQPIVGLSRKSFVFSAFYNEVNNTLRVMAILDRDNSDHLSCIFYNANRKELLPTDAEEKVTTEVHAIHSSAFYELAIICPNVPEKTEFVSIIVARQKTKHPPGNCLRVVKPIDAEKPGAVMCVRIMSRNYKDVVQLIEFIEFHALIGFKVFMFYVHGCSPQVACILKHLASEAMDFFKESNKTYHVFVTDYELPFTWIELYEYAMHNALNDCVLRTHALGMRHAAGMDLDEMLMLPGIKTLPEILESHPFAASFAVSTRKHFPLFLPDDELINKAGHIMRLRVLKKTLMDNVTAMLGKTVVDVERAAFVSSHQAGCKRNSMYKYISVPSEEAIIHHYRLFPGNTPQRWTKYFEETCNKSSDAFQATNASHPPAEVRFMKNRSMWRFSQELTHRVFKLVKELPVNCNTSLKTWESDQEFLDSCHDWTILTGFICSKTP